MVLDGNSIVNRAFYGIRLLTTRDGTPTNGVYGFLMILQKLLTDETPDAVCVTFDLPAPTFRHEQFEAYKAQRKGMPDELAVQMPVLKDVLDALRLPRYELAGWEADDLIGTISKKCEDAGWDCVIVTGDKDSFQLVSDKTHVRHVKSRMGQTETTEYTPVSFTEEYGFEPIKMIDLKALMGDASDNIPGVAGIGEKTALELVRRFGSVQNIYESLDTLDVKDGVRKKLVEGRDAAAMSYTLATICRDVPMEFTPEDNIRQPADNDVLYALFQRLEFTRLTDKFGLKPPSDAMVATAFVAECRSIAVETPEDMSAMERALSGAAWVAVHFDPGFYTAAVLDDAGNTAYILRQSGTGVFEDALRRVMADGIKKAGHDIKDTQRRLLDMGIESGGWIFDAALAGYLLSPTDSSYELKKLAERYADLTIGAPEDQNGQLMLDGGDEELQRLLSETAAIARLRDTLAPRLCELGMDSLFDTIELPLCRVLAKMEHRGFYIDKNALREYGDMLSEKIAALEAAIYELAGEQFNINSPKQLGTILFDKLMLPAPKRTKTGYSTNIEVLEHLAGKHPIIRLLMDFRELTKLKSTYVDGLMKVISSDGRIHTNFQMTVAATGRLSSTEPNLQNIPIRKELGGELRKMFVAGEGNVLVDADYSQIELRILAHIADDKAMQDAFKNGEDIHAVTASQVFMTPLAHVTPLQRSRAKAVNFGIVYGISAFSLSQDIGVSVAEAKLYIDSYFEKYSGVRAYMKDTVEKAKRDGYVTTLFGRRRYLPELKSSNFNMRSFGERAAMNTPIQGTAADVMKLAMVGTYKRLKTAGLSAQLILQVHDELIAECPACEAGQVQRILTEEMENAVCLSVPLTAEAHVGKSWSDAK
ncbi:DNA polymerase I [Sporobacter termitidis]|nr:DNA polymerase I [Sporobacter termitidis]